MKKHIPAAAERQQDVGGRGFFLDKPTSGVLGCPKFKSDSSFNGVCFN